MSKVITEKQNLQDIANAIRTKDGTNTTMSPAQMSQRILDIPSDDWQPQPDWWDIKTIIQNDVEDYGGKMIALTIDNYPSFTFTNTNNAFRKLKFSDGAEIELNDNGTYTHEWDTTKDKPCSLGYKTRYIIFYSDASINFQRGTLGDDYVNPRQIISLIIAIPTFSEFFAYGNLSNVECIEFINVTGGNGDFSYCESLKKIINPNYPNRSSIGGTYLRELPLKYYFELAPLERITNLNKFLQNNVVVNEYITPENFDMSKVTNYQDAFRSSFVRIIDKLDFTSATNVANCCTACSHLITIKEILGKIKTNGIDISSSLLITKDTVLRFLDALYDYSEDSATHTIKLGTANLSKLTAEEIAIGTNKGWTIS